MSYDVSIRGMGCVVCIRHGGIDCGDYTYNCGPMLKAAIGESLSQMDGQTTEVVAKRLDEALTVMHASPEKFREMNPSNGWGDFDSFRDWLARIAERCREYPGCIVRVK